MTDAHQKYGSDQDQAISGNPCYQAQQKHQPPSDLRLQDCRVDDMAKAPAQAGIGWIGLKRIGSHPADFSDSLDQRLGLSALGQVGDSSGSAHGVGDGLIGVHG